MYQQNESNRLSKLEIDLLTRKIDELTLLMEQMSEEVSSISSYITNKYTCLSNSMIDDLVNSIITQSEVQADLIKLIETISEEIIREYQANEAKEEGKTIDKGFETYYCAELNQTLVEDLNYFVTQGFGHLSKITTECFNLNEEFEENYQKVIKLIKK